MLQCTIKLARKAAQGPGYEAVRPPAGDPLRPLEDFAMTDIDTKKPGKAGTTPKFELPKFDIPKFDMPKVEMPEAFRDMAEKGVQLNLWKIRKK